MLMEDLKSISQACFVSLPHKRKSSSKTSQASDISTLRDTLYREAWARLESGILQCQKDAQADALNSMVDYIQRSNPGLRATRDRIEVPCGALVMGVNMSDHGAVFGQLTSKLRASVTKMVVSLQARDCSSTATMMHKVVSHIPEAVTSDLEMKKRMCTMTTLTAWYKSVVQKTEHSPRKKAKRVYSPRRDQPMVIIIEEVEGFKPSVLEDFILICSNYVDQLPLVLVLGISTTVATVHRMIPQRASSCLSIETFSSMPVTEYLNRVFQEVLLDPLMAFKLGPHVFQLVQDVVLFHDFSLTNLLQMLKMCLFEHYYSVPESVLCCPENQLADVIQSLDREGVSTIMSVPSVQRCTEDNKLSSCYKVNRKTLTELVTKLHRHHRSSLVMLEVLREFSRNLPNCPLGRQFRDTYFLYLERPLSDVEGFRSLLKLTRLMSRDDVEMRLRAVLDVVDRHPGVDSVEELSSGVRSILRRLEAITKEEVETVQDQREGLPQGVSAAIDWGNVRSRSQFKEKLKDLAKSKKQSPFEELRDELAEFIGHTFSAVIPPTALALHEALYFDDAVVLKRYFLPSPRSVLHAALVHPQAYLQDLEVLPDLSLAYKLHLEGGKLINLYDWMQSFRTMKAAQESRRSSDEDRLMEARFFRSVTELQFLGYIKSTQRKTDHVARMTWGSC